MTDSELEDQLFTYLWLSLHTPNAHAGRVCSAHSGSGTARPRRNGGKSPREGRDDASRDWRVSLNESHPRGETLRKVIVCFGEQQNDIAVLRQGDGNSVRQCEDIPIQQRVYVVPV